MDQGVMNHMSSRIRIRILCLLLCAVVLLPCVSAFAETTRVTAYLLRLRATPSTKGAVLDAYPRGTVVTILKKGAEWTRVRVHNKTGYMQTSFLAYSRSSGASSSDGGDTMYVMKGIRLNLREEASSSSGLVGSYRGGTPVTVLRRGKYWSYVRVKGEVGYMWNDYLVSSK